MESFHKAEIIQNYSTKSSIFVQKVNFHGIKNTKTDALKKEIKNLYFSQNFDDLVRNSFLASRHMQEVGLFDNCMTLIDTFQITPDSYVVNFYVKEPKSFNVEMKLGLSMGASADANLIGSKKSILGRAESAELSYTKTIQGHGFDFYAIKPYLGWQKYSNICMGLSKSFNFLQWNKSNVTQNLLKLQLSNRFPNSCFHHLLKLNLVWRYFEPKIDVPFAIREHAGHTSKVSFENTIEFDTRDRPLIPSRGFLSRLITEYAGFIGDSAFLKNQIDLQFATYLFSGIFLTASIRSIMIHGLGNRSIHLLDRVYLGGSTDIKGFKTNSIGNSTENISLGGSFSCATAMHLYKSLVPVDSLFLHFFLIGGGISSVMSRNWLRDTWNNPRISTGAGLAFVLKNLIRLEVNYTIPLCYLSSDFHTSGFQFGIGTNYL